MKISKYLAVSIISIASIVSVASAYYGDDYQSDGYNSNNYGTEYKSDPNSGNNYTIQHEGDQTEVYGSNSDTGSQWHETIQSNGDMNGTDKNGNTWTYDRSTGYYQNSDGVTCSGHGALRTCD